MSTSSPSSSAVWLRRCLCLAAVGGCGIWAIWPLPASRPPTYSPMQVKRAEVPARAFDQTAFAVPIWYVQPAPVVETHEPAKPTSLPFKLQLIAIVREGDIWGAVFYNPMQDALMQVNTGESLGEGRVVDAISAGSVRVRDDTGVLTVALDRGGS